MNESNFSSPSDPAAQSERGERTEGSIRRAAASIKTTTLEAGRKMKTGLEDAAATRKDSVSDQLSGYSAATHESARAFEGQDPNIAHFTHQAADRLERIADYVRDRDFKTLRTDAENFARRHPVAFFGGLFVTGLIAASLLKAGSRRGLTEPDDDAGSDAENLNEANAGYDPDPAIPEFATQPSTAANI